MADTFFVGQTGDPLQVAAVSLTNPIFILFMAFANMFGMGGSAAASMAMGVKNEKRMKQVSAFVTYASISYTHLDVYKRQEHIMPADKEIFLRLQERSGGLIKLVDIAPEEKGAMEFIEQCHDQVKILSLIHILLTKNDQ